MYKRACPACVAGSPPRLAHPVLIRMVSPPPVWAPKFKRENCLPRGASTDPVIGIHVHQANLDVLYSDLGIYVKG
jgi:hypothetical protein